MWYYMSFLKEEEGETKEPSPQEIDAFITALVNMAEEAGFLVSAVSDTGPDKK